MKIAGKILAIIGAAILVFFSIGLIAIEYGENKSVATLIIGIILFISALIIVFTCTKKKPEQVKKMEAQPLQSNIHKIESGDQTIVQSNITKQTKNQKQLTADQPTPQTVQPVVKQPIVLQHFTGLPVIEHTLCTIFANQSETIISSKGSRFTLPNYKITDVSVTTSTEIQKAIHSSIGGAVGGAVLFGPVGAMIGGRAKERKITKTESYLVFTYEDNGELKYIAFYATEQARKARKFVKEFLSNVRLQQRTFDL